MNRKRLLELLDAEVAVWSQKSFSDLISELDDVSAYDRGVAGEFHQFEVQMIEHCADYVHVIVSIDDGSLMKSIVPPTLGFIVHRDGRVET